MPVIIAKPCVSAIIFDIPKTRKEKSIMRFAEFEARKRWDTSIMTEEEKEVRIQRILACYGSITDETFVCPEEQLPVTARV